MRAVIVIIIIGVVAASAMAFGASGTKSLTERSAKIDRVLEAAMNGTGN